MTLETEVFVKILRGELPAMAASDCEAIVEALGAHDAELLEECAKSFERMYWTARSREEVAACVRAFAANRTKREKGEDR